MWFPYVNGGGGLRPTRIFFDFSSAPPLLRQFVAMRTRAHFRLHPLSSRRSTCSSPSPSPCSPGTVWKTAPAWPPSKSSSPRFPTGGCWRCSTSTAASAAYYSPFSRQLPRCFLPHHPPLEGPLRHLDAPRAASYLSQRKRLARIGVSGRRRGRARPWPLAGGCRSRAVAEGLLGWTAYGSAYSTTNSGGFWPSRLK